MFGSDLVTLSMLILCACNEILVKSVCSLFKIRMESRFAKFACALTLHIRLFFYALSNSCTSTCLLSKQENKL